MGSSVPAIKSLLMRARENLKKSLSRYVTGEAAASEAKAGTGDGEDDDEGRGSDEPA